MPPSIPPEIKSDPKPGRVDGWNPRFLCYARSQGWSMKNIQEFVRNEWVRYPGGLTGGFARWLGFMFAQYGMEAVNTREPELIRLILGDETDQLFNEWLYKKFRYDA